MLKRLSLAASIAALVLGLAASAASAADKPVYGVLMKTLSNPFWGAMEKGVDRAPRTPASRSSWRRSNPTRLRSRSSTRATPCCRRSPWR